MTAPPNTFEEHLMSIPDCNLPPGFKTLSTIATIPAGRHQKFEVLHQAGAHGDDFVAIEFFHGGPGDWRPVRGVRIHAENVREVADTLAWAADQLEAAAH